MSDFRKYLEEQLEDPEFKAEWDALQPERALVQAMDISKFENGSGNPSIKTLQRLAAGMGMVLQVEFKPATGIR